MKNPRDVTPEELKEDHLEKIKKIRFWLDENYDTAGEEKYEKLEKYERLVDSFKRRYGEYPGDY